MRASDIRRVLPIACAAIASVMMAIPNAQSNASDPVEFVFTSDAHYGITRPTFRGETNVDAHVVNTAMLSTINALPEITFGEDGGLRAGQPIGPLDFLVEGGDIANREELTDAGQIQPAAASWAQFQSDYLDGVHLTNRRGDRAPWYIVPGNHDASNAVGFYKRMTPLVDKTSMVEIYNRMLLPSVPKTTASFEYARDRVLYTRDQGGIHFMFLSIWPDSSVRAWMDRDLARISPTTPVVVFTHDQPDVESKHLRNPNGAHGINDRDKFENVLIDDFADGSRVTALSTTERTILESFLGRHRNITAYFHGNSNWNQFYDWTGPRHTLTLHTFRVDSPMKGAVSLKDETKLSFQVATIDPEARRMTVRECLWNVAGQPIVWGDSTTVSLQPAVAGRAKFAP